MRFTVLLLPLLAACAATADVNLGESRATEAAPRAEAGAPASKAAKKAAKAAYAKADRAHALAMAQLDLELAELENAASTRKAQAAEAEAQRKLQEAERALHVFLTLEAPRQLADAQLDLDRADHRRESDLDELNELIAMYEAEEFAEMTKELVLKRGRKGLEFSERALALERSKLEFLRDETLAQKERELQVELEQARRALAEAQVELTKTQLESRKKLADAQQALTKLERPLDEPADEDQDASGDEQGS